jgi:hypothetical protein
LPQHPNYCRPKTLKPKQEIARVGRQYDGTGEMSQRNKQVTALIYQVLSVDLRGDEPRMNL